MLKIDIKEREKLHIIELVGILNAETTQQLHSVIREICLNTEKVNILINLENLSSMSSAGIGLFIGSIGKIRDKNGDIRFCNVTESIKRVFELLEMENFFIFYDNMSQAENNFQ